ELGWVEGRNLTMENRAAEGIVERAGDIAAEFARLKVDVIVLAGDAQGIAVRRAAPDIPIVLAAAGDPVGNGLVASLARPGGNVTGMSVMHAELGAKRLEMLKDMVPTAARVAVLLNPDNLNAQLQWRELDVAAPRLGVQL